MQSTEIALQALRASVLLLVNKNSFTGGPEECTRHPGASHYEVHTTWKYSVDSEPGPSESNSVVCPQLTTIKHFISMPRLNISWLKDTWEQSFLNTSERYYVFLENQGFCAEIDAGKGKLGKIFVMGCQNFNILMFTIN